MKKRSKHHLTRVLALAALFTVVSVGGGWLAQAQSRSFGGINLTQVIPRIVTPNGDSLNDVIFFNFDDTLTGLPLETAVLDIYGAKVSGLALNNTETSLLWDGKDSSGRSVPAGIYVYSIKIGKNRATGTVVVAK